MIVLIATAGRPDRLDRTLRSLCDAELPQSLDRIVIVENGPSQSARVVCERFRDGGVPIEYLWTDSVGKSVALNHGLRHIDDPDLVFMTDDDIELQAGTLAAYERAFATYPEGCFFGGGCRVECETDPPSWVRPFLPASAQGWQPDAESFNPKRHWFLGCNWACRAGDLKAVGGFNQRFGPGASTGATGQETEMQARLQTAGLTARIVPEAVVTHHVEFGQLNPQWVLQRAYRNGISRGLKVAGRPFRRRAFEFAMQSWRYLHSLRTGGRPTLGDETNDDAYESDPRLFSVSVARMKAKGYFEGRRIDRAA